MTGTVNLDVVQVIEPGRTLTIVTFLNNVFPNSIIHISMHR